MSQKEARKKEKKRTHTQAHRFTGDTGRYIDLKKELKRSQKQNHIPARSGNEQHHQTGDILTGGHFS